tara:strand:- start:2607 stop:2852 length:246 start_codon:yes stop_codon:yes gene_type:complete
MLDPKRTIGYYYNSMRNTNKIRKGSLYFNNATSRVERVRGIPNSQSVLTTNHGDAPVSMARSSNLRPATLEEVESYLAESE